jgi:hypothetical protein
MNLLAIAILIVTLMLVLMAAAFLLARHLYRRPYPQDELSPVSRQHIDLFQGGQLSEAAVESAKDHFRTLLERGETEAVEAYLRAGMHYVIHVRALAEIGTDDAGRILERQLQRRLTDDQVEQAWYWIDLASSLRSLNREQSLPHLLRCAESANELPLGQFFAAETVCFLSFAGYLRQAHTPLGETALRVLHRALEGLRHGVQPQIMAEARLGEAIENLWDHRPETVHPLVVRVFVEALRQVRRAPHAERVLTEDRSEQEAYQWQLSRLAALEPVLDDYLSDVAPYLRAALAKAPAREQRDILLALNDLRADAAPDALKVLAESRFPHADLAVEVLTWSRDPQVAAVLRNWVISRVPMDRRALKRKRTTPPRQRSVPADVPYRSILRSLRGHPSLETESFLMLASNDYDPVIRVAALGSLGWWEPVDRRQVLHTLQLARRDASAEVRQAARAALARLGERQSLQWFRQALCNEDTHAVHETIQVVANEGLTLLWPDLDRLADVEDHEVSHHAREALERLCEDLDRRIRLR